MMTKSQIFYLLVGVLIVVPYFQAPWWKFVPSLIALGLLARWRNPTDYLVNLGLRVNLRQAGVALAVFASTMTTASLLVPQLLHTAGISIYHGQYWHLGWQVMPLTQSLMEELVLRAMLLNGLLRIFKSDHLVSFSGAVFFALWHVVFFQFTENAWLGPTTILTLGLFGYASNKIFLAYGNIAVPLALHAGWNVIKFGGEYANLSGSDPITEARLFDAVEGSWVVFFLATALWLISERLFRAQRRVKL